jgi:protein-tyrosine-phosphatase
MASPDPGSAPPEFVRLLAHPLRWKLLTTLAESDYRVRELVTRVGEPQNLVSYHLRLLRGGGLVTATRSSYDGRDSYYHLNLERCAESMRETGDALHPALREHATPPIADARPWSPGVSVLFVCTGNSARSPIAEALLRHHTGDSITVTSAGTQPAPDMQPHTVRVLREEYGIDISGQRPRHLDSLARRRFDRVITLCDKARELRFDIAGQPRRVHWSITDPATASRTARANYAVFRHLAADIDIRVRHQLSVLSSGND